MFHAAHAPGTKSCALHNQSIELHFAISVKEAAASCVKGLIIFHDHDCFLDRVERRAPSLQHLPASRHRIAHAIEMSLDHVIRNGPCTAVDEQNWIYRQEKPSPGKRPISLTLERNTGGSVSIGRVAQTRRSCPLWF